LLVSPRGRWLWREFVSDERPKMQVYKVAATLLPAHARPSVGLRLQKLFCRCYGRSWRGRRPSHCRESDRSNVGRILPLDSESLIARHVPALDSPLEQSQARISGKRQHQRKRFCASFWSRCWSLSVSDLAVYDRHGPASRNDTSTFASRD
jgi:hypothetical protein